MNITRAVVASSTICNAKGSMSNTKVAYKQKNTPNGLRICLNRTFTWTLFDSVELVWEENVSFVIA